MRGGRRSKCPWKISSSNAADSKALFRPESRPVPTGKTATDPLKSPRDPLPSPGRSRRAMSHQSESALCVRHAPPPGAGPGSGSRAEAAPQVGRQEIQCELLQPRVGNLHPERPHQHLEVVEGTGGKRPEP